MQTSISEEDDDEDFDFDVESLSYDNEHKLTHLDFGFGKFIIVLNYLICIYVRTS